LKKVFEHVIGPAFLILWVMLEYVGSIETLCDFIGRPTNCGIDTWINTIWLKVALVVSGIYLIFRKLREDNSKEFVKISQRIDMLNQQFSGAQSKILTLEEQIRHHATFVKIVEEDQKSLTRMSTHALVVQSRPIKPEFLKLKSMSPPSMGQQRMISEIEKRLCQIGFTKEFITKHTQGLQANILSNVQFITLTADEALIWNDGIEKRSYFVALQINDFYLECLDRRIPPQ
jgi:hypothetical protein